MFLDSTGDFNVHSKLQTRTSGFAICQALFQVLGKKLQNIMLKKLSTPSNVISLVCATGVVYYHTTLAIQELEDVFTEVGRDGPDSNTN